MDTNKQQGPTIIFKLIFIKLSYELTTTYELTDLFRAIAASNFGQNENRNTNDNLDIY
jgi:hypothetical protein